MAHAFALDTLSFARKIEASGMAPKQAEAITEAIRDVFEEDINKSVFTNEDAKLLKAELKADISNVKAELKAEISDLKTELKTEISDLKADMFKLKSEIIMWVVGLMFAQTAIIVSIIKFIH